jgi:hypothetical protein
VYFSFQIPHTEGEKLQIQISHETISTDEISHSTHLYMEYPEYLEWIHEVLGEIPFFVCFSDPIERRMRYYQQMVVPHLNREE